MNEADVQVLASIMRAEVEAEPSDRATLEKGADRYWTYLEDWSGAWQRLLDDGLIQGNDSGYSVTERGRPLAEHYYAERPDRCWYYYRDHFPAAQASAAHARFCERVFGKDLTQDGQADIDSVNDLIAHMEIGEGDKVLDLGCGAGGISEYLSDATGAHVTGLDYSTSAIDTASRRTNGKGGRLAFVQGDMNALDFPDRSFHKIVLVDTIYWIADIDNALASLARLVEPGGSIGIFVSNSPMLDDSPEAYELHGTWIAESLKRLGLGYDAYDYTQSFLDFWPNLKKVGMELKDDYIAEGNELIIDSFLLDADEDYLPAVKAGKLRRFLYIATV